MKLLPNDYVRPIGDDERNAFFKIVDVTRNGWARCIVIAYANGERPWSPECERHVAKFRTRDLRPVADIPMRSAAV